MALSVLQQKTGTTASATSLSITPNSPITAGSLLIFETATSLNTRTVSGFTDTNNGWNKLQSNAAQSRDIEIWYVLSATAGTYAIQCNVSGSAGAISSNLIEFSGNGFIFSATDQVALNSGSSTSPVTGTTSTLGQSDELAFGAMTKTTTAAVSSGPTNSYNALTAVTTNQHLSGAWLETSSTTGTSTGWTITSTGWVACIGTIKVIPAAWQPRVLFRAKTLLNRKPKVSPAPTKLVISHWLKASRYAGKPIGLPVSFRHKPSKPIKAKPVKLLLSSNKNKLFRWSSIPIPRQVCGSAAASANAVTINSSSSPSWYPTQQGNTLVVVFGSGNSFSDVSSITVSGASLTTGFVQINGVPPPLATVDMEIWYCNNGGLGIPAGITSVTVNVGGSATDVLAYVYELPGVWYSDRAANAWGSSTSPSSGPTPPLTASNEFAVAGLVKQLATAPSAFPTSLNSFNANLPGVALTNRLDTSYKSTSSGSAVTASWTIGSTNWSASVATLLQIFPSFPKGIFRAKTLLNRNPTPISKKIILRRRAMKIARYGQLIVGGYLPTKRKKAKSIKPSVVKLPIHKPNLRILRRPRNGLVFRRDHKPIVVTIQKFKLPTHKPNVRLFRRHGSSLVWRRKHKPLLLKFQQKPLVRNDKLLRLIQPPSAALGYVPKMLRKRVKATLAKSIKLNKRSALMVRLADLPRPFLHRRRPIKQTPVKALALTRRQRVSRYGLPSNLGIILKLIHKTRKPKVVAQKPNSRRYSMKLLRLIQPPSSALGIVLRVIHKTHKVKNTTSKANPRRFSMKLLRLVQPPASALGMWLKVVKRPKALKTQTVKYKLGKLLTDRINNKITIPTGIKISIVKKPRKYNYKTLKGPSGIALFKKLKNKIQPPSSALGIVLKIVKHPKPLKNQTIKYKLGKLLTEKLGNKMIPPFGIKMKLVKDPRAYKYTTPKIKPGVPLLQRIKRDIQPPAAALGIVLRVVHKTHKIKTLPARPTLRVYVMRLLRTIPPGPPAVILSILKRSRKQKYQTIPAKHGIPLFKRLKNKIQPPSAALGIWLRTIKKPKTLKTSTPKIKLGTSLWDKLKNKIAPGPNLGMILRLIKDPRKQKYQFIKVKAASILTDKLKNKIIGPTGLIIRLIKDSRKQKYQTVKVKGGTPLLARLKNKIQPPASALAVLPRLIFKHRMVKAKFPPGTKRVSGLVRWKSSFSIPSGIPAYLFRQVRKTSITLNKAPRRVYTLKKLKGLIQPPSAALGVVLKLVKKPKTYKYKTVQLKRRRDRFGFFTAPIAFIRRLKPLKKAMQPVVPNKRTRWTDKIATFSTKPGFYLFRKEVKKPVRSKITLKNSSWLDKTKLLATKSVVYVPRRHKLVIKPVPKKITRVHKLRAILFSKAAGTIDVFLSTSIALSATLNKAINSNLSTNITLSATLNKAFNVFLSTSITLAAFINIQPLIKKILKLIMPLLIRLDLVSPLTSQTVNLIMPLTPQQVNLIMPLTMTNFTLVMPLTPETFTIIMPLLPE